MKFTTKIRLLEDNILNLQQMNKEQLEKRVKELDVFIQESDHDINKLREEQKIAMNDLKDIDKPELTIEQFDELQHIVESACEVFEIDTSECDMELSIDYDNRICIDNLDWSRVQEDLSNHIVERMEAMFRVNKNKE
tara:strand:+ start:64 stop:474 length:411 start_codon:yes stop_codon:yes gene_type:complete